MKYRNSLRFRIFATFTGTGLLLGPLLALAFITLANELEEFAVERVLLERLNHVMSKESATATATTSGAPNMRVFGDIDSEDIPADIQGKTGIYTIEPGKRPVYEGSLPDAAASSTQSDTKSWFLAVGQRGGITYVVASDQTLLELRESLSTWVIAAGTVLSVCASLWLGYYITSRLIRPLQQLAAATADDGGTLTINPQEYPPDEIGQLATALKRKHDDLTQALVREKAFSAEVAHELRNPLAIIQSTIEIIERDSNLAARSAPALERALDAIREMKETLAVLLLLGREQNSPAAYPTTDVAQVLLAVVEKNALVAATQLQYQQSGAPCLSAPAVVISMIADNLIRNALQHAPTGYVEVLLHSDRLVVRDTGTGIPVDELAMVRKRGVRGSNAFGAGSGLGLALVDRLCDAFGWNLQIQSQVNVGTTVTWWLDP